ncbi:MAG: S-layer homology domain-containing protein [Clostridia bacterium]|nr:S-layer homology domain-containing protein [Clostridia bacterium]
MKNLKIFKRSTALLLAFAMLISCLPIPVLGMMDELSEEALRVSDEFAAQYPHGLLDIVNQNTITEESSGEIHFYVARRGGTDGEVDVSVKAIEMTAKYGEDFVFIEEGFFSEYEVEKKLDTPTMLESSIADFGDEPVTVYEESEIENTEVSTDVSSEYADTPINEESDDDVPEAIVPEEADGFDESREYASSLHQMRDEILNKNTKSEIRADSDLTRLFEVDNREDVLRDEAMSAVMPGAFINLHFDDGENYKVIKIKIIDDSIVEAEEAFMLGLFDCEGAELGNNATSNVCIVDNEQKTEETKLYFEEEYISAYDCDSTVRLKVVRQNNTETYQLLQVQTMGNTAEADVNYSSLVTEAVLLAGQEYKYIDIPIKRADIAEPLDFEVRVSGAGCNEACAIVTIYPYNTDNGVALKKDKLPLMAANNAQPTVTIKGNAYRGGSYADSGRVYTEGNSGVLELNSDNHRWGYLYYDVDLRGIEKVRFSARGNWADTRYPERVKHKIYIEGGSKTIEKQKNWGWEEFEFGKNDIPHKQTTFVANADSWYWNDSRLWIDWITLYKQQITLSYEQPETFKIPIYESTDKILGYYMEDGLEKIVAPQASISALNKESSRPNKYYRDDTVTLNATLSSDGKKHGAYLKGYELYNPTTGKYTYFDGTELTLTPEIIYTYVYGDGKTYRDTLKIKPVYGRRSVTPKLTVGNYLPHKGTMTFGGNVLNPGSVDGGGILTGYTSVWRYEYIWDDFTLLFYKSWLSIEEINNPPAYVESQTILGSPTYKNTDWCVGDYIAVTLTPASGYTASAINDLNGNKISIGTSNTMYVQLKESGNGLFPVFNRNDCGVTFMYEGNTDGLYVFHDKKLHADSAFLDMLYRYTGGLTNWTNDEIPVFTGRLNDRIKENYDMLRKRNMLNGQKLSNLAIGDVVTVYAEAPDGYIPYWYVDDNQKTITTEGDKRYARHYGNSFSFEMTSNDVTLYCGMERKTASDYVMTGKLVKPSRTLKGDGYAAVNPEIPASYMTVPGASLSVLNFDERFNSVEIGGTKYYSSVISDADGNFKMYIPNVSNREYFSIKYANGVQTKATTLLAANGKTYYIVIPANDENYTVNSIDCYTVLGDMAENNGLIKIPYSSAGANRTFMVGAVSANESYGISAVRLNSYRKDGSRIVSINMTQSSAVGLETNWRANVNIAEALDDGGRITVEVFDKKGNSRGEVESGYVLEKELPPANISISGMPGEFSEKGLDNVPIIGNNVPTVPDSSFSEELDEKTMEIAVGQGETLKKAIYSQLEEFNNSDNWSKLMYLTEYISDTYSTNVSNSKTETKDESSGSGKNTKFPIMFDFGMYMKLDKNKDGTLSLNYVFVTVGLKAVYTAEWQWVIGGIPLYVTISAGGSARGLIGISGTKDYFNHGNVKNEAFYALLGKYGQDEIANKHYDEDNLTDQKLFAALYNQSNLTKDKSQAADVLSGLFDEQKKEDTVNAIDALLNRYDFYYINQEIFEEKMSEFSYDLQNRINMYKQLVTVKPSETEAVADTGSGSEDTEREPFKPDFQVEYDAAKVKQAWIHRFNMLLVLESLPKYLDEGKTTYDISSENFFGLGGADTPGGGLAVTGIVTLQPSFAIGAGVGMRGAFSIGVSGHIDFVINWQPWSEARGTVTFAVNADIDLLIIPLSVRLVGYTVEMFRTDGYLDNAFDVESGGSGILMSRMRFANKDIGTSVNTSPERRGGDNKLEAMPPISLFSSYDDGLQYIESTMDYQTETTKHPQPEMYLLPNGNKLIIYMNDNLDRALYDRNSVYYSVFDKNTEEWSQAQEIEEDGTLDGDIESMQLEDGRVIVVWTDSDRTFGDELPEMADLVTSQNISLCIFDENGTKGDVHDITTLAQYGYSEPAISCTDNILTIVYKITDYHTSGVEFDYDDIESTYQSFVSSSYESLAITEFDIANGQIMVDDSSEYALYEENSGIDLNGMRFVDTDIQGLENPKLYDVTQASFDGKSYIVYTMDTDNNTSTKDDRELFCIIRENGENSKPVRLTDNNLNDSNANIVTGDLMNKIYFGSGRNICTINLEAVTAENMEDKGSYFVMNNASQQSDSVLEYESEEAADGFEIFMGKNGMLYMLWTQFKTVSEDDGSTHKSRALYMKTYDPMFITAEHEDEENGTETGYIGAWGLASEILDETDLYINEPALVVTPDNEYSLAYRIFGMEELTDNGVTYEKEQDTSVLCVSDFVLVSSISAKKTNQYPVYPKEGDFVSLDFECENYGVIPSDMIQFNYYIETDADIEGYDQANDCWWEKGDGVNSAAGKSFALIKDSALYEGHMATGSKLGDSVQFIMPPFEKEVSIYVMAWEDDIYTPEISKIPVNIAPELEAYDMKTTLSDDETELTIQAIVRNTGNYPAENVVLKLNADGAYDAGDILLDNENTDFGTDSVNNVIGEIEIPVLAPDDTYELDYTIVSGDEEANTRATLVKKSKLTEKYFTSDGTGTFTVSADYDTPASDDEISTFATIKKKSKLLAASHTHTTDTAAPTLTNITVEDPSAPVQAARLRSAGNMTVELDEGETKTLNISLEPYGSDKAYSLIYESADTSVAEINSSNGEISGISEGNTTVYVKAVKNGAGNIVLVDTQTGDFMLNDGEIWDFENDTSEIGGEVVMTKEISVKVTAPQQIPEAPSALPAVTIRYTVNFETNGGTVISSESIKSGSSLEEPTAPTKEGYIFAGWFTDKELTDAYDFETNVTSGFTLYAKWEKQEQEKPETKWENPFTDVDEDAWYYEDVKFVNQNKLMQGISETDFAPNAELTRAMLVTVLWRMENEPVVNHIIPFDDVEAESWYTEAIRWAAAEGIVNGYSETEFAPDDSITREQIATIMHRYASYKEYDVSAGENTSLLAYNDHADISDYAVEAMQYASGTGLIRGKTESTLNPADFATRAEIAAILHRFITSEK